MGRGRHPRRAPVRLAGRDAVAGRRQRRKAQQRGLADRDVRREVVAGTGAEQRHQQRRRGRRVDSLRDGGRRGFGLALVVVQGLRHRRQRGPAPQERRRYQAPLHARQLQQVRPPGLRRASTSRDAPSGVLVSAYKGTDGTVVVVAINKSTSAVSLPITIAGGTAPAMMTPWVTSATDNLVSKTAVAGERRQLHRRACRHDRHDVRRQVTRPPVALPRRWRCPPLALGADNGPRVSGRPHPLS